MSDSSDSQKPSSSKRFEIGTLSNEQNVNFQVDEVNNLDVTHIKIVEDRLTLILDRNKDKLRRTNDDDLWPWVALLISAIFNIATCLPPVLTSEFKDGFFLSGKAWTRLFDLLALCSILWVIYIGWKVYDKNKKLADTIDVDQLVTIIKNHKYNS